MQGGRAAAGGALAAGVTARDRKLTVEHTKRVSKALRSLKEGGSVRQAKDWGGECGVGAGGVVRRSKRLRS